MRRTVTLLHAYVAQRGLFARVAKRLGLDPSYISRVANGRRKSKRISLAFFAFPAHWRHRLRTTNLGEGWFKHLRRYLSRFPGCRNAEHSEQVLGCFLLAAESMHR